MNNCLHRKIIQLKNTTRVDNALVIDVFSSDRDLGYLVISYPQDGLEEADFIQNLRLNVNPDTILLNSFGHRIKLSQIQPGMWINAVFSSYMTRSIPPQANALFLVVQKHSQTPHDVTVDRIAAIDEENMFLYTGAPHDIYTQTRFVVTDTTPITDIDGKPVGLKTLKPGDLVKITHANFQTASIPPQSPAFHIQLL